MTLKLIPVSKGLITDLFNFSFNWTHLNKLTSSGPAFDIELLGKFASANTISSPCPIRASTDNSSGDKIRGIFFKITILHKLTPRKNKTDLNRNISLSSYFLISNLAEKNQNKYLLKEKHGIKNMS